MKATHSRDALAEAAARARGHSPFLHRLFDRNSDFFELILADGVVAAHDAISVDAEADIAGALRQARQQLAMATALGDLSGILSFTETVHWLSDFADFAVDRAISVAFAERFDGEEVKGFAAIALGKHGSRELNYSSDVDLILLFDPATLPHRNRDEPQQVAVRIARRIVEILQERTEAGYVFRVDLRLRPSPEATPIALPVNAAISHYESSAEAWERAAFIRARTVGGDREFGDYFLSAIRPFIWRRALDFGAISEIRAMSRRIRDHYAQGQQLGPGYDLKRGRGGIREIEFYAQIHQLIHGGRDETLRAPATLDALAALSEAGQIDAGDAQQLSQSYVLLRTFEHRLQMVEDRQTHSLPPNEAALDNVARLHGLKDGAALLELLAGPVAHAGALYDDLEDEDRGERLPSDSDALENALQAAGFTRTGDGRRRIQGWREGSHATTRSPAAREALEAVLPSLIADFGASPDPLGAINRFDSLLDRLPSAVNFFRLLEARPGLGSLLASILSHSPALADEIARRAELFDGLIDATAFDPPEPLEELTSILRTRSRSGEYQLVLDRMRQLVGEERFALGVQLVCKAADPLDIAGGYARVAEAALAVLADATIAEFGEKHGRVPDSEPVILALGRLGGEALTHASDLDIVYLFTGDHGAESDGERPLGATTYYQRLAQRITAAMSVPTASGPLYEVDTRLRPSGNQGLLAVSLQGFACYHRDNASSWEHMALARARPVFGSDEAREKLSAMIGKILGRPRDAEQLREDVLEMRTRMAGHKRPASALDVKLVEGGLVDLEFCVHFVQLRNGVGVDPRLWEALAAQRDEGLIAPVLVEAHDLMTRLLVTMRLVSPESTAIAEPSRALVARACARADWRDLEIDYEAAREVVRAEWRRLIADEI